MIDLDALEALAKAAAKGPWIVEDGTSNLKGWINVRSGQQYHICEVFPFGARVRDIPLSIHRANADFIAATDPSAILELIARVRKGEQS